MSARSKNISSLSEKINLLLECNFNGISSQAKLAEESKIDAPQINRWVHPTNIGIETFKKLCNAYAGKITPELWEQPLDIFAKELNLQLLEAAIPAPIMNNRHGIDFESRTRDLNILKKRFDIMKGCWDMFCYSLSISDRKYITYGLLEITSLNDNGFMECVMEGENLDYHGYCFLVGDQTHFQIEASKLGNEILYIITGSPKQILNPMLTGILNGLPGYNQGKTRITPTAVKVALCHVGTVANVRKKYQLSDEIPHTQLADKIEHAINASSELLNSDILDAIDNHIPLNAVPYALRADIKNTSSEKIPNIVKQLEQEIDNSLLLTSIEQECLRDYQTLLKCALDERVYRFVKLSQYYERIRHLVENSKKSMIATYLHDNYDYQVDELSSFSEEYFLIQKRLISEKKLTICRIFISESAFPDDFLLKKMYREEKAGVDVSYLQNKYWVEASLEETMGIVDFTVFDEEIVLVHGEKELFCAVQSASIVTSNDKISKYKELFKTNRKRAKSLTTEMREKVVLLLSEKTTQHIEPEKDISNID